MSRLIGLSSILFLYILGCAPQFLAVTTGSNGSLISNSDPCPGFTVPSADFTVNSALDTSDAGLNGVCDVGGGVCTLRAAIEEANNVVGVQKILIPAGLTINVTAQLNINESVQIFGANMTTSIVDGGATTRIFTAATNNLSVEFDNMTVRNGKATGADGGAFFMRGGTTTVKYAVFSGNVTTAGGNGGAIYVDSSFGAFNPVMVLQCSRFSGNTANGAGGGVYVTPTSLTVADMEFSTNTSVAEGGALWIQAGPAVTPITIDRVLFKSNTGNSAGAYFQRDAVATIRSSTFYLNSATTTGGAALYTDNVATLNVYNSTFAQNSIGAAWGSFYRGNGGGTFNFANNIVWGNSGGDTCFGPATITSLGHNIFDDPTGCNSVGTDLATDPVLGVFAANGGFTSTLAIGAAGSANNTADASYCPTTDQRGYTRAATCDIGGFELQ